MALYKALISRTGALYHFEEHIGSPEKNIEQKTEATVFLILARFLEAGQSSEFTIEESELAILRYKGYDRDLIELWGTALLDRNAHYALDRLCSNYRNPPLFILLIFLQRAHLGHLALQRFLRHLQSIINKGINENKPLDLVPLRAVLSLFLPHANSYYSECVPAVAGLCIANAKTLVGNANGNPSPVLISQLSSFFNFLLVLLSTTSRMHPVLATLDQGKAQFAVLRFMASHEPQLYLTQDGFRAMAKVQAAHRKTGPDREWAQLKSHSWPPWKTIRNAMDEGTDVEKHGISRANQILRSMRQAGYVDKTWDKVVEILSGWDTDGSPTIQQRARLPDLPFKAPGTMLWAARIRATRTHREAWACFLACEGTMKLVSPLIYNALAERLFYRKEKEDAGLQRGVSGAALDDTILPGDGLEVWPDPTSTSDLIHLDEPIPTYEQLWERIRKNKVPLHARLLAVLLDHAPTWSVAEEILRSCHKEHHGLVSLLEMPEVGSFDQLHMPAFLFASFIRLLCRFGEFSGPPQFILFKTSSKADHALKISSDGHYRSGYAHALLCRLRPPFRPAWTAYMKAILASGSKPGLSPIMSYKIVRALAGHMEKAGLEPDAETVKLLSKALERTIPVPKYSSDLVAETRLLFQTIAGTPNQDTESNPVPIPKPLVLHTYVRVLGSLDDFEGLYSFSSWMTAHQAEIMAKANATQGGPRHIRRIIVALRVFLEKASKKSHKRNAALIELVRAQIEGVESWGGWPTDEEVEIYKSRVFGRGFRSSMTAARRHSTTLAYLDT